MCQWIYEDVKKLFSNHPKNFATRGKNSETFIQIDQCNFMSEMYSETWPDFQKINKLQTSSDPRGGPDKEQLEHSKVCSNWTKCHGMEQNDSEDLKKLNWIHGKDFCDSDHKHISLPLTKNVAEKSIWQETRHQFVRRFLTNPLHVLQCTHTMGLRCKSQNLKSLTWTYPKDFPAKMEIYLWTLKLLLPWPIFA